MSPTMKLNFRGFESCKVILPPKGKTAIIKTNSHKTFVKTCECDYEVPEPITDEFRRIASFKCVKCGKEWVREVRGAAGL